MEHLGVSRPVVGVTVPTGYSFNLDGTAIYLTMASLFIAEAMGNPLDLGEQISLLVLMMIASKGAAGVTGAGLATLAAGLQTHRPDLGAYSERYVDVEAGWWRKWRGSRPLAPLWRAVLVVGGCS